MKWLVCFLTVCVGLSQALPTIVNPRTEKVDSDKVTLSWDFSGDMSGDYTIDVVVKEYHHALNPNIKGVDLTLPKGSKKATITKLKSGTTYAATIRPSSASITGSLSTRIVYTTHGIKPPRNLKIITITDSMITFEWSPPTGEPIDATRIRLKNNDNDVISSYNDQSTPTSEYTIKGLAPGTPYIVMIQSKSGDKLSTVLQKGLRTGKGTITPVQMSKIEPTSALAEWSAPSSRESNKISHYEVVLIVNHATMEHAEQPITYFTPANKPEHTSYSFNDLIPDRFYAVKVRTIYETLGHGPFSKPTFFQTTPQAKPSTPLGIVVNQATKEAVDIAWKKPEYKHDIVDYEIQYAKKNTRPEPLIKTNDDSSRYVLGDLESGTQYTIKVRAYGVNQIVGEWSTEAAFETKGPKPVSSVSVTEIKDASAKIGWTTYTGSTPENILIKYQVTGQDNTEKEVKVKGNLSSRVLDDLKPSSPYKVLVFVSEGGELSTGVQNGMRTPINIAIIGQMPKEVDAQPKMSHTRLEVSFKKVPNRLVKFYEIQIQGFDIPNVPFIRQALWPPSTHTVGSTAKMMGELKNIQSGWRYKVTVRAIYGNNETGSWSLPIGVRVGGPRPPRVISILDITEKSAEVHWKSGYEASDSNVPNNLHHNVTLYRFIGDSIKEQRFVATKLATSSNSVQFISGIEATGRYNVRVFSQYKDSSNLVKSTYIEKGFRAGAARLPAPILISRSVTGSSATIFWNRIPNRSDIKHYEIHLRELDSETFEQFATNNALEESFTFTTLKKQVFYEFKVRGIVSSDRKGMWLIDTFYVPGAPIKRVENVNIIRKSSSSVTLLWQAGNRADLKKYEIELKSQERGITETVVTKGLTNSFKLEDLHPGTSYQYRIRAVSINENDKGEWSVMQSFKTEAGSPLSGGMSKGVIVGIALAAIAIIVIIIVAVMICRKRRAQPFQKFDSSVKFQRNPSQEGGLPSQEMDDTATAIRNGKKLYI